MKQKINDVIQGRLLALQFFLPVLPWMRRFVRIGNSADGLRAPKIVFHNLIVKVGPVRCFFQCQSRPLFNEEFS